MIIFFKHQKLTFMRLLPQEAINDEIDLPELAEQIIMVSRSNAPPQLRQSRALQIAVWYRFDAQVAPTICKK